MLVSGYGQDEDQGQLGGWYVISSLGLFDVKGLSGETPSFGLSSTLFDKIRIELNPDYYSGKEIIIQTEGNSSDNIYVQSVTMNGKPYTEQFIPFETLTDGAVITMGMGNVPSSR